MSCQLESSWRHCLVSSRPQYWDDRWCPASSWRHHFGICVITLLASGFQLLQNKTSPEMSSDLGNNRPSCFVGVTDLIDKAANRISATQDMRLSALRLFAIYALWVNDCEQSPGKLLWLNLLKSDLERVTTQTKVGSETRSLNSQPSHISTAPPRLKGITR